MLFECCCWWRPSLLAKLVDKGPIIMIYGHGRHIELVHGFINQHENIYIDEGGTLLKIRAYHRGTNQTRTSTLME